MATSYIKIDRAPQRSSGLIIRQKEPKNLETPFDKVDSFLTPTELFYIRSHLAIPKLELERAGMEGDVCEIVLEGADHGMPDVLPVPPAPISYARSLVGISNSAGSPDRLSDERRRSSAGSWLPGASDCARSLWNGSVKWLTRIHAVREPFPGYWQTSDYAYWDAFAVMAGGATHLNGRERGGGRGTTAASGRASPI